MFLGSALLADAGMVLWLSLPLVGANMLPVLCGDDRWPMDFGQYWSDGRRLLGPGKTWTGFIGGIILAIFFTTALASAMALVVHQPQLFDVWQMYGRFFWMHMWWLAFGALLGDVIKSFIKRRVGLDRGRAWLFFDQFDAVIGGFGLSWLCDRAWFEANFIPGRWLAVTVMLIVYYLCHQALSRWAHDNGWKTQPH